MNWDSMPDLLLFLFLFFTIGFFFYNRLFPPEILLFNVDH